MLKCSRCVHNFGTGNNEHEKRLNWKGFKRFLCGHKWESLKSHWMGSCDGTWTLSITAQDITENAGVTVTQESVTGTLQTALTGTGTTSILITAGAGTTFVTGVDVVVGSTTVAFADINTATDNFWFQQCNPGCSSRICEGDGWSDDRYQQLGSQGSRARYGCCPSGKYMSTPTWKSYDSGLHPESLFSVSAHCSSCPVGQFKSSQTSIDNDETSCELCERGKCSAADSTSCSLCHALPNGNGEMHPVNRIGSLGGVIDDITGSNDLKKLNAIEKYGPIIDWDMAQVTDMSNAFYNKNTFNAELSNWATSAVTTMAGCFYGCSAFNGDVSNFVTTEVTSMAEMFNGATVFNRDVSKFSTSKVTNMNLMFASAKAYNGDLAKFDLSKVTNLDNSTYTYIQFLPLNTLAFFFYSYCSLLF